MKEHNALTKIEEISDATAKILNLIGIFSPEDLANANAEEVFTKIQELKRTGQIASANSKEYVEKWICNARNGDWLYSLAKVRYESLKTRSFNEFLRPLLYWYLIEKNEAQFNADEVPMELSVEIMDCFKSSFGDMKILRETNKEIQDWEEANKAKVAQLWNRFNTYFSEQYPYGDFKSKYGKDSDDRMCHYCKIKESEIELLIQNQLLTTKRLYSRGRSLEIDRTDPNKKYNFENTELCCYWCNNAKSDEFDKDDFNAIGEAIAKIWAARLKKIKA